MQKRHKLIISISVIFLFLSVVYFAGYRINVTPSLPLGIYKFISENKPSQNAPGDMIGLKKDNLYGAEQNRLQNCHFLIKNVLAIHGDIVELDKTGKKVKINGVFVPNMIIRERDARGNKIKMSMRYPCTIPEGFVFVGTNYKDGYDSRYFGLVPETEIIGKMRLVYAFK